MKSSSAEQENVSKPNPEEEIITGMNTRVVSHVRYSGPFLKWTREELGEMD